jgi:hypothetical protein
MMQEDGGRIQVGFVDKKQKDKVYMLGVSEKADDYEVLDANLDEELAKIRKGQEEQWLSMKVPGAVAPPKESGSQAATASSQPVKVADIRPSPTPPTPNPGLLAGLRRQSRYAAIRRAEIAKANKAAESPAQTNKIAEPEEDDEDDEEVVVMEPPSPEAEEEEEDEDEAIREAEIQAHLQNYQKELIRQGLPPLPIPLTPKTDAELVQEGTLAPLPAETEDDEDE